MGLCFADNSYRSQAKVINELMQYLAPQCFPPLYPNVMIDPSYGRCSFKIGTIEFCL
jgi:hypothetical protein